MTSMTESVTQNEMRDVVVETIWQLEKFDDVMDTYGKDNAWDYSQVEIGLLQLMGIFATKALGHIEINKVPVRKGPKTN